MKIDRILHNQIEKAKSQGLTPVIKGEYWVKEAMQETALQFAEWLQKCDYGKMVLQDTWYKLTDANVRLTTAELFTIFNNEE